MAATVKDRRLNQRYGVHIPIQFRVSERGVISRWASGTTGDISSNGVRFRSRKPLQVGAHIEMVIAWPAKQEGIRPMHLHVTGFIVRRTGNEAAVRMNSCRFQVDQAAALPIGATA